jgi:hypothetical protein
MAFLSTIITFGGKEAKHCFLKQKSRRISPAAFEFGI